MFINEKIKFFKKKVGAILTLILLLNVNISKAQSYAQQSRQLFAYNILLNGCIGGIGGAINKSKNETIFKAFGKNFLKASLGGAIMYEAKYMVYPLRNPGNFWIAPLIRAGYYVGYSFTYNASLNKSMFDTYHCQFYVFNFDIPVKEKTKMVTRISVTSMLSAATMFTMGDKLDILNSLKYGVLFFNQNRKFDNQRYGFALSNSIEVLSKREKDYDRLDRNSTIAHEMIHTFQFPDYFSITNIYYPSIRNIQSKKNYSFKKYIFVDVPYFAMLYALPTPARNHLFEHEAYHFETRKYVNTNNY